MLAPGTLLVTATGRRFGCSRPSRPGTRSRCATCRARRRSGGTGRSSASPPRRSRPGHMSTATTSTVGDGALGSTTPSERVASRSSSFRRTSGGRSSASAAPTAGSARATTSPSSPRSTARRRRPRQIAESSARAACWRGYPNVDGVLALTAQGRLRRPPRLGRRCAAAADARRLRRPSERRRLRVLSPRLRGQPARRADRGHGRLGAGRRRADRADDPAGRRVRAHGRGGRRGGGEAAARRRRGRASEPVPASELVLALQCGGSDGYSGVTANPALGRAADVIVRQGGTVVLGETTEIYGAEHLLTRRARQPRGRREARRADQLVGVATPPCSAPRSTTTPPPATRPAG